MQARGSRGATATATLAWVVLAALAAVALHGGGVAGDVLLEGGEEGRRHTVRLHARTDMTEGKHGVFAFPRNDLYIGRSLRIYGEWSEGEFMDIYSQLIKPGHVVLDVGANIGAFTVALARLVGPTGLVHAFEPMNAHLRLLSTNLVLNGLENVEVHHAFVSAREDGPFRFSRELSMGDGSSQEYVNYGGFSMLQSLHTSGSLVPVLAIDDLNLPRCDFIKADVEGAELGVILGAQETIQKFRPYLYLEIDESHARWEKVVLTLHAMNYTCIRHIVNLFREDNFKKEPKNLFVRRMPPNSAEVPIASHMMICAARGTSISLNAEVAGAFHSIVVGRSDDADSD